MSLCSIFVIWVLLYYLLDKAVSIKAIMICTVLAILPLSYHLYFQTYGNKFKPFKFFSIEQKTHFDKINSIMNKYHQPTLINVMSHEYGYGILSKSLPGCKYWAYQNGATDDMYELHKKAILAGDADFLYVKDRFYIEQNGILVKEIMKAGYTVCYSWGAKKEGCLFVKKTLCNKNLE